MTRDEVLEMARQAGYDDHRAIGDCAIFDYFDLERFAALVAERTREECAMGIERTACNGLNRSIDIYQAAHTIRNRYRDISRDE